MKIKILRTVRCGALAFLFSYLSEQFSTERNKLSIKVVVFI